MLGKISATKPLSDELRLPWLILILMVLGLLANTLLVYSFRIALADPVAL